jgi:hypothetical protein
MNITLKEIKEKGLYISNSKLIDNDYAIIPLLIHSTTSGELNGYMVFINDDKSLGNLAKVE